MELLKLKRLAVKQLKAAGTVITETRWPEIDLRMLGFVRILTAAELLWDLFIRWNLRDMLYRGTVLSFSDPWYWWHFSLLGLTDDLRFRTFFFGAAALSYLALLVGFRTRASAIASFVLFTSFASFHSEISCAEDSICQSLLFWFCLLPTGSFFSWDRRCAEEAGHSSPLPVLETPIAALILMQFALMYLATGFNKLHADADVWRSGLSIFEFVSQPRIGWGIGRYFVLLPAALLKSSARALPYLQIVMALLFLLVNSRLRIVAVLLGVILHLGIALTMWTGDVWFYPICGLLLCLSPTQVSSIIQALGIRIRSGRSAPTSSKRPSLGTVIGTAILAWCLFVDFFDHNPAFDFRVPGPLRIPVVSHMERMIFRGQHWAMYTGEMPELTEYVLVADTNQGPVDVSSAFMYPWMIERPAPPKHLFHHFAGDKMPLIHRRIEDSIFSRLGEGCHVFGPFFDFVKERYEGAFPELKIQRIHWDILTDYTPPIDTKRMASWKPEPLTNMRYATWTP